MLRRRGTLLRLLLRNLHHLVPCLAAGAGHPHHPGVDQGDELGLGLSPALRCHHQGAGAWYTWWWYAWYTWCRGLPLVDPQLEPGHRGLEAEDGLQDLPGGQGRYVLGQALYVQLDQVQLRVHPLQSMSSVTSELSHRINNHRTVPK